MQSQLNGSPMPITLPISRKSMFPLISKLSTSTVFGRKCLKNYKSQSLLKGFFENIWKSWIKLLENNYLSLYFLRTANILFNKLHNCIKNKNKNTFWFIANLCVRLILHEFCFYCSVFRVCLFVCICFLSKYFGRKLKEN